MPRTIEHIMPTIQNSPAAKACAAMSAACPHTMKAGDGGGAVLKEADEEQ